MLSKICLAGWHGCKWFAWRTLVERSFAHSTLYNVLQFDCWQVLTAVNCSQCGLVNAVQVYSMQARLLLPVGVLGMYWHARLRPTCWKA